MQPAFQKSLSMPKLFTDTHLILITSHIWDPNPTPIQFITNSPDDQRHETPSYEVKSPCISYNW